MIAPKYIHFSKGKRKRGKETMATTTITLTGAKVVASVGTLAACNIIGAACAMAIFAYITVKMM
jgi:hypothetical protein